MDDTMMVAVDWQGKVVDLRIPTQIKMGRLKELLREVFQILRRPLPSSFELMITNKPFRIGDHEYLSDYPLGNGDQFRIEPIETMPIDTVPVESPSADSGAEPIAKAPNKSTDPLGTLPPQTEEENKS